MSRESRIEQLADLLSVRLGSAPLDEMGGALVITLAAVITGYPHAHRHAARDAFVTLLDTRLRQLTEAGVATTYDLPEQPA